MKNLIFALAGAIFLFSSCEKKDGSKNLGTIEFAIKSSDSKLKSTTQTDSSKIAYAIVTIKGNDSTYIYNNEELVIYKMGDSYITKPISLKPGSYELTGFMITNSNKSVTYATPYSGSKLSYLVENPLSIKFNIAGDEVLKLTPEVISTIDANPSEFGYSTFSFNVINTFKILVAAFVYDSSIGNYILTNASLNVKTEIDNKSFNLELGDSTNHLLIPEKDSYYNLEFSKAGHSTTKFRYSKEELKMFGTNPLKVYFDSDSDGLVLHLMLNNNAVDYSGLKNNGTLSGPVSCADRNGSISNAYKFDGINDYIEVPNSPSLNPTNAITVSAWYKTTPFVGSGNDGLVNKAFSSHVDPYYQYHLGVCGNNYWNGRSGFGFSISLNDTYKAVGSGSDFYELYKWYHVVGTYDGSSIKLYVNGSLINSIAASGSMKDYGSNLFIGRQRNKSEYYNTTYYVPGSIDDVRIYNRALSATEISNLYRK